MVFPAGQCSAALPSAQLMSINHSGPPVMCVVFWTYHLCSASPPFSFFLRPGADQLLLEPSLFPTHRLTHRYCVVMHNAQQQSLYEDQT